MAYGERPVSKGYLSSLTIKRPHLRRVSSYQVKPEVSSAMFGPISPTSAQLPRSCVAWVNLITPFLLKSSIINAAKERAFNSN